MQAERKQRRAKQLSQVIGDERADVAEAAIVLDEEERVGRMMRHQTKYDGTRSALFMVISIEEPGILLVRNKQQIKDKSGGYHIKRIDTGAGNPVTYDVAKRGDSGRWGFEERRPRNVQRVGSFRFAHELEQFIAEKRVRTQEIIEETSKVMQKWIPTLSDEAAQRLAKRPRFADETESPPVFATADAFVEWLLQTK